MRSDEDTSRTVAASYALGFDAISGYAYVRALQGLEPKVLDSTALGVSGVVKLPSGLQPLGLGSTGRTVAKNLEEQLAMSAAKAAPINGRAIVGNVSDPRWKGWTKMQSTKTLSNGKKIIIHYVAKYENGVIKAVDDFKFK